MYYDIDVLFFNYIFMSNEHLPDEQIPLDGSELLPADDILPESKFPLLNKIKFSSEPPLLNKLIESQPTPPLLNKIEFRPTLPLLNKMPEPPLEEDRRAVRKKAED